ncbi:DUF11 domain-containing protein [Dokdonella soli]|uniref:DUF11 domain-containing protein n=1 Tax=Dokdonella soli TaxID=529810 RepID=A0ABN1IW49_9GAMM
MRTGISLGFALVFAGGAGAAEVTVKNDSLANNTSGAIQAGFVAGEKAAAWLTTPCDGNIVAAQVFWRSLTGGAAQSVEGSVDIYRSGSFPNPGTLAQRIIGPQLTDGVINEYRYLDTNNTIPLSVPVIQNETFVVALTFAQAPDPTQGPSVVDDAAGLQPNRNAIYANISGSTYAWMSNADAHVNGNWVIRAVVNCQASSNSADVAVTMTAAPPSYTAGSTLQYTITVSNAGPAAAPGTNVTDTFPAAYTGVMWTCTASGGASCGAAGSGNIAQAVGLPAGSQVTYTVNGTVAASATGTLVNAATAIVSPPVTDPNSTNNTARLSLAPMSDLIFANGFD